MFAIYRQSRSNHRRGFTGTLFTSENRRRSCHTASTFLWLIDAEQASRQIGMPISALELGVANNLVPHYFIEGQLLFDPGQLHRWLYRHDINIVRSQDDEDEGLES